MIPPTIMVLLGCLRRSLLPDKVTSRKRESGRDEKTDGMPFQHTYHRFLILTERDARTRCAGRTHYRGFHLCSHMGAKKYPIDVGIHSPIV